MTICLPSRDRAAGMRDAGARLAGRLDDDLDIGARIIAMASSVKRVAAIRSSLQPTARQAARARSGDRSAMAATCNPGVVEPGSGTSSRTCRRRSGRRGRGGRRRRVSATGYGGSSWNSPGLARPIDRLNGERDPGSGLAAVPPDAAASRFRRCLGRLQGGGLRPSPTVAGTWASLREMPPDWQSPTGRPRGSRPEIVHSIGP